MPRDLSVSRMVTLASATEAYGYGPPLAVFAKASARHESSPRRSLGGDGRLDDGNGLTC
jgi:hypothetical protein